MRAYDNPQCSSLREFESDVERFTSIRKLCAKADEDVNLVNVHLLLNHAITSYNLFGSTATELILNRVPREQWSIVVPVIRFLNQMPEYIPSMGLNTQTIVGDEYIIKQMEKFNAPR